MEIAENTATIGRHGKQARSLVPHGAFTTAAILRDIAPSFFNPLLCRFWVIRQLHRAGARCPSCGQPVSQRVLPRFLANGRVKCNRCGKFFTALTGTFLAGTHMGFTEIFFLAFGIEMGFSVRVMSERTGLDPDTVRLWRDKFRFMEKTQQL